MAYRIDNSTAATTLPTPGAVGPNPNGYFTKGDPASGIPATVVDDDWANMLQEEVVGTIEAAGLTASKTNRAQLSAAIPKLIPHGAALFASSATFTVPANVYTIYTETWAGGAGGGGSFNAPSGGSAGGGGAYVWAEIDVTPGQALSITVGAAGAGGAATPTNGTSGGSSYIGSHVTAGGGGYGLLGSGNFASNGGIGGVGSVSGVVAADIVDGGGGGLSGEVGSVMVYNGTGGQSYGAGPAQNGFQGSTQAANGAGGFSHGAGGSGGVNGGGGGAGVAGYVRIWW